MAENSGRVRVVGIGDLDVDLAPPSPGKQVEIGPLRTMLRGLRDAETRLSPSEKAGLVGGAERGRLAKFQPYLPEDLEALYLSRELLDLPGAATLASESGFPVV